MPHPHAWVGPLCTSDRPVTRPVPDNTQHSHIHAPDGIPTCNPSKRAVADRRLTPRDHRDRHITTQQYKISRNPPGEPILTTPFNTFLLELRNFEQKKSKEL